MTISCLDIDEAEDVIVVVGSAEGLVAEDGDLVAGPQLLVYVSHFVAEDNLLTRAHDNRGQVQALRHHEEDDERPARASHHGKSFEKGERRVEPRTTIQHDIKDIYTRLTT